MSEYLNNAKDSFAKASESLTQNLPDTSSITSNISDSVNSIKESAASATSEFSSSNAMNAGQEFLNSNSMIAKFVFVILVLVVFMFLLNVGLTLVSYLTSPSKSPYVIHGMLSGSAKQTFPQDPASGTAVIYRSNNQSGGAEFTWSMWLKVDNMPTDDGYKCVFVKGSDKYDGVVDGIHQSSSNSNRVGISPINNGPGVYLFRDNSNNDGVSGGSNNSYELTLLYIMDVVSGSSNAQKYAIIPNLPIGNWFNVAIRLQNKSLDCYVNGVIVNRISFGDYIPKQNYDPIIYAGNSGFAGSTSNLRYYDYALSVFEINSIVYFGPNLSPAAGSSTSTYFDYLGQSWYTGNVPK